MSYETLPVQVRLSKLTLELADQQARLKHISRSAWLRDAILKQLQEEQRQADLQFMEQRLLDRLTVLQTSIINGVNAHTTREINTLVSN